MVNVYLRHGKGKNKLYFWENVRKTRGCWIWVGAVQKRGTENEHPSFGSQNAKRTSYEIAFGELTKKSRVSRICDNRLCVNPDHLIASGQNVYMLNGTPRKNKLNFWDNVKKGRNCWEWTGSKNGHSPKHQYGTFANQRAHRYVYEMEIGEIPNGMCVLHRCDNTLCVNPRHLFTGTQTDNINDMIKKGRGADNSGIKNPRAKLSHSIVRKIRIMYSTGLSAGRISKIFNIPWGTAQHVCYGRTWRHLL